MKTSPFYDSIIFELAPTVPNHYFFRFTLKKHKSQSSEWNPTFQPPSRGPHMEIMESPYSNCKARIDNRREHFKTFTSMDRGTSDTWKKLGSSWSFDGSMHYGHTEDSAGTLSYALGHHQSHLCDHWELTALRRHHHRPPLHRTVGTDYDELSGSNSKNFFKNQNSKLFSGRIHQSVFSAGKDGVCCYSPARVKFLKRNSNHDLWE